MNEEISLKLDEVISCLKNDPKILRMQELKEMIYSDKQLKKDLEEFNKIKDFEYSDQYISLKSKIIDNPIVREYRELEKELYFTVLKFNSKLNALIERGKC